jgi:hypothetical protein
LNFLSKNFCCDRSEKAAETRGAAIHSDDSQT